MRRRLGRTAYDIAALLLLALAAGCGGSGDDVDAAASNAAAGPPQTVEDLLPETGSRGLVLNRCSSCHAVACAALGQRTDARWDEVEASHADYIPGLSIEDRGKIFDYLKRNFSDRQPEPQVPPHLLAGGCPRLESSP